MLEDTDAVARRRSGWWGLVLALALGAAAVAAVRLAGPPIYDGNGYFNIRFAEWIREHGISRSFPWFQEAIHRTTYANFNLLYHLFLIPFTFGDLLTGARIAGIVGGALAVGCFFLAVRMLRVPAPLLWTILVLAIAPDLLYRLTFTRALVLGLGLTWLALAAILTGRMRAAAILGFLFPYVHVSFHLLPAMAAAHDVLRTPGVRRRLAPVPHDGLDHAGGGGRPRDQPLLPEQPEVLGHRQLRRAGGGVVAPGRRPLRLGDGARALGPLLPRQPGRLRGHGAWPRSCSPGCAGRRIRPARSSSSPSASSASPS
jgi:hypothetical protein